jgi:hypothetical protein
MIMCATISRREKKTASPRKRKTDELILRRSATRVVSILLRHRKFLDAFSL